MKIFNFLCSIPGIGVVVRISNAYAFHGDLRAGREFAGWHRWSRAIGPEVCASLVMAFITAFDFIRGWFLAGAMVECKAGFICQPGALLIGILPSILGFGIGVYALIFALSPDFVNSASTKIDKQRIEGHRSFGSVLMFNADLAYPLIVLIVALVIGVVQQSLPTSAILVLVCWIVVWYAFICLLSLVSVIHGLADHSLLEKSGTPTNKPSDDKSGG